MLDSDLAYRLFEITFKYGDQIVLDIPELSIRKHQITTLIGSNGAGKTTLLNLLTFLHKPASGELYFNGIKVDWRSRLALRRRIALVAQRPYLLHGTVLDNITLGLRFRGVTLQQQLLRSQEALETVGIEDLADRNVKDLSGGEAQKVALARALALQAEILLMDEPFTHLDSRSTGHLESLLTTLIRVNDMTVILSTHYQLQGIALADQVISLVVGRTVNTPLLNLYHGKVNEHYFDTGKIPVHVPDDIKTGHHIVVDPVEIVLSRGSLTSSMRNSFQGRVVEVSEDQGRVWITVDAGEKFYAQITTESLHELSLNLGSQVWVNFKSTSVKVF